MNKADLENRLTKLYNFYEDIQQASLGSDWETKIELKHLSKQVSEEIKNTISALKDSVVKV